MNTSTDQQEIYDLEILSNLFLVELNYEKQIYDINMELKSNRNLKKKLYEDIIISNHNNESLKKNLQECVELLKLFNNSYALNLGEFKLKCRPMLTNTIYKATTFLQNMETVEENINIEPYKTVSLGRDENKKRYAVLKKDASNEKFDVYEISDYVGSRDFKVVSNKPIGEFNTTTRVLDLY